MTEKRFVIIGDGPAGVNASERLRTKDSESQIILIGQEPSLPYSPTVLPYFISGKITEKNLFLHKENYWRDRRIELVLGKGATSISPKEEKVLLKGGSSLTYDSLILAPGGNSTIPDIPGLKDIRPLHLRTLADAKELKRKARRASAAIILGAGLIGMQAAQSLAEMGLSVKVVELMDQVLPGYFDPKASNLIRKAYESHRVTFFTSARVEGVEWNGKEYSLSLKKEKTLHAPLLFAATGVTPNIEFLGGSGIKIDRGIIVDKAMRTSIPNIFASGDAVQAEDFWGGKKVNQPILIHAVDQGRMAAESAMGEEVSHCGNLSMNLFHFFGNLGLSIGLVSPDDRTRWEVHQVDLPGKRGYVKFVFDGDCLCGVMGINTGLDPGILLQLIRRRIPFAGDKKEFLKRPLDTGRKFMCLNWR